SESILHDMREEDSKTKSDFEQAIFDSNVLLLRKSKLQQFLHRRLLPRSISKWLLLRTNQIEIDKLWRIEHGEVSENASPSRNRSGMQLIFVLFSVLILVPL